MKDFKTFIFEAPRGRPPKPKQKFSEKTHLQKMEEFQSGLRRLNKIYRDVNPERIDTGNRWEIKYSEESYKRYNEAKKIFLTFANNFEHWVYKELIDMRLVNNSTNKEPDSQKLVRSAAWNAFIGLSGGSAFPETGEFNVPDFHRFIKEKDKNVRTWNENFKHAFRAIKAYIEEMGKADEVGKQDEIVSVKGVRVIIPAAERTSFHEKPIKNYIQNEIPFVVDLLNKKGFKTLTRHLEIEFNFDQRIDLGGEFHHTDKGKVMIYILGMAQGNIAKQVLLHELAHRFYYNNLKKSVRDLWDNVIINRKFVVTRDHVNTMAKITDENGQLPKNINKVLDSIHDPSEYVSMYFLAQELGGGRIRNKDHLWRRLWELEGKQTYKEYISYYAGKNAAEAFAEALSLYLLEGPRRLQPFTRKFLQMIVGTTGIYLKENEQQEKMKIFNEYIKASINEEKEFKYSATDPEFKEITKAVKALKAKKKEFENMTGDQFHKYYKKNMAGSGFRDFDKDGTHQILQTLLGKKSSTKKTPTKMNEPSFNAPIETLLRKLKGIKHENGANRNRFPIDVPIKNIMNGNPTVSDIIVMLQTTNYGGPLSSYKRSIPKSQFDPEVGELIKAATAKARTLGKSLYPKWEKSAVNDDDREDLLVLRSLLKMK